MGEASILAWILFCCTACELLAITPMLLWLIRCWKAFRLCIMCQLAAFSGRLVSHQLSDTRLERIASASIGWCSDWSRRLVALSHPTELVER